MDCPSEEGLIKMQLASVSGIHNLKFNLNERTLTVLHETNDNIILNAIEPLKFGATLVSSTDAQQNTLNEALVESEEVRGAESKVLKQLLAINAFMFVGELTAGVIAQSTGLIADSLDMFADAAVYGMSFYAVGKALSYKISAAKFSGYLQVLLALMALSEIIRRFFYGSEPEAPAMVLVAFAALVANVTCLVLLAKHREGGVHMKASWIFSTNDVIANIGVIVAGVAVYLTGSHLPDLIIGTIIALVVFTGAIRILNLSRGSVTS
jgi:Co/Zn/Cd efflux system component